MRATQGRLALCTAIALSPLACRGLSASHADGGPGAFDDAGGALADAELGADSRSGSGSSGGGGGSSGSGGDIDCGLDLDEGGTLEPFDAGQAPGDGTPCVACPGTCTLAGRCVVSLGRVGLGVSSVSMVVAAGRLYFTSLDGLQSVPVTGGTPATLVAGGTSALSVSGSTLAFARGGGSFVEIVRADLDGGALSTVATGQVNVSATALTGSTVTWTGYRGVARAPVGGGAVSTLAVPVDPGDLGTSFQGLAVDDARAYFTTYYGALLSVPLAGGAVTTLVASPGPQNMDLSASMIEVAGGVVDWMSDDGRAGLRSIPAAGGAVTTLASGFPCMSSGDPPLATDGASVYWGTNVGQILRAPLRGGAVETLAVTPGVVAGVAVDATSVYWILSNDGSLYRLTPR